MPGDLRGGPAERAERCGPGCAPSAPRRDQGAGSEAPSRKNDGDAEPPPTSGARPSPRTRITARTRKHYTHPRRLHLETRDPTAPPHGEQRRDVGCASANRLVRCASRASRSRSAILPRRRTSTRTSSASSRAKYYSKPTEVAAVSQRAVLAGIDPLHLRAQPPASTRAPVRVGASAEGWSPSARPTRGRETFAMRRC